MIRAKTEKKTNSERIVSDSKGRRVNKMRTLYITVLAALILLPAAAGAENLVREYRSGGPHGALEVEVWADNEDGIYYEGESISIYFQASRDCFVAIYSIDTQGDVNLLFPTEPWENGFIEGGETYAIPGDHVDYDLIVSGPEGIEYIQAVASEVELDIPDWYSGADINGDYYDDRDEFIEFINDRHFNCRWDCERAFDQALIYVKVQRNYYKPVYYPSHWYDYDRYSMIYIDYPYGAEFYIDGIYFGIAPLWIPRVIYGYHWFTIYDRYGYCWESRIHVYHDNTIYLDRSRVKTTRTVTSRYKNLRLQPQKYDRSKYVVSEKRVKSSRALDYNKSTAKFKSGTNKYQTSKKGYSTGKTTKKTQTDRYSKKYRPSSKDSQKSKSLWNSSGSKKSGKSGGYKKSSSGTKKSGSTIKSGSSKSSGTKKSGSTIKSGSSKSSGSKKSGSTIKSGSSKSSGTKKSSGTVKSSGTKKSSGGNKSSSSGKSSGSYKSSSRSTSASSAGRVSTGRSSSGKSGGQTSRSGGKKK